MGTGSRASAGGAKETDNENLGSRTIGAERTRFFGAERGPRRRTVSHQIRTNPQRKAVERGQRQEGSNENSFCNFNYSILLPSTIAVLRL